MDIRNVGTVEVSKKSLEGNFTIHIRDFLDKYGELIPNDTIREYITEVFDSGKSKIDKSDRDALENLFDQVKQRAESGTAMGFSTDERSEAYAAEDMKRRGGTREIQYDDKDPSTGNIETYDSNTGKKEGEIILGSKGAVGELVPVKIVEKVETHFKFNAEEDIEEDRKTSGQFIITNPSETNKIWDIDLNFEKDKSASIDDDFHLKNLDPGEEHVVEYELEEFEEPALKVSEFISTINDEEVMTTALTLNEDNVVLFKLTAKNIRDYPIRDITIKKEIIENYMDVNIIDSEGETAMEDNSLVWTIPSLDPDQEASVKLNMTINIPDTNTKPKTGQVSAEYYTDNALTGIKIDKFDAYSDNFVGIQAFQQDDDPDKYDCAVMFENESDFQVQLVNLDISTPSGDKVLDIDPNEIPVLASGATWQSVEWETKSEDGLEPQFHKTVEFFLVADRQISTMGSITIDDIELAVAIIEGRLDYNRKSLPSFRITDFMALLQVKNTGGADLNELVMQEIIQPGYVPPTVDQIELYKVSPQEGDDLTSPITDEDIDWEDLGEQLIINPDMIEISPEDQEPDSEHTIRIKLEELMDSPIGMITPGTIIRAKYPIQAMKPARDSEFISDVKYIANTFPAGAPIEIIPEAIHIPVIHERKKLLRGKKVKALAEEGQYEITLTIRNAGENALEQLEVKTVIPENFEYGDYSEDPTRVEALEGKDMLIWLIETLDPKEKKQITYHITGVGDEFKASDAQFSV